MGGAIGIDLGTTNSCAACIVDGKSEIVLFPSGARTIPSVFAIDKQGKQLIGQEAKEHGLVSPDDTVMASKRLLGRSFKIPQVNQMKQIFTYELQEGESSEILVKVADQVLTLEQVSASILQRIKLAAEAHLDQAIDKAVITVPAYFNDRQRQSVRLAGKMAGLKVLRILNEPTAAALAYGLGRNVNQRVAVYDLGGGTFDISLIDIRNKVFEVLATGGDTFLGGVDFDDRVMQWVLQKFSDDTGIDVSFDHGAVARIRDASETAKIRLSFTESTKLYLENIAQDEGGQWIHLDMKLNRRTLEELTGDLVERSIQTCDRILREAGSSKREVDELLLVGGQSRMPLVRAELERFLGKPSSQKVHPDEAVAIGAAIMAHTLSAKDEDDSLTLLDVLPMAIGIAKSGGKMHVLFRNNQPLPDFKTRSLTTSKDNQRSILLRMYQGESEFVKENEVLGTFTFSGLRQAPKGDVKLSATFHIDTEGILSITAVDGDSGEKVETQLTLGENPRGPEETRRKKKKKPTKKAQPTTLNTPQASMASSKNPAAPPSGPKVSKPPLLTRMFSIFGTTAPAKKSKKKTPPVKAPEPKSKKATQTKSAPKKKEAASITPPPLATPTASISKPKKSQAPKKKASTKKKGKSVAKKAKAKNDKPVKEPAKKRSIWGWFGSGKGGSK